MTVETVSRAIQLILAPAVILSTCAILLSGLLTRYGVINDRLRAFAHERLELLRVIGGDLRNADVFTAERLSEIDLQIPGLLRRLRLAHHAVLSVYMAVLILIASIFSLAFAAQTNAAWAATLSLVLFLSGAVALFIGALFITTEVRSSLRAVQDELERVAHLPFVLRNSDTGDSQVKET